MSETIDITKDHLFRIGRRIKGIRAELSLSHKDIETELDLPGSTLSRLETGKGIHIFNLLALLSFFDSLNYNIKWIMIYDNSNLFKKNEDGLALYTFDKKEFSEVANEVISNAKKLVKLSKNI